GPSRKARLGRAVAPAPERAPNGSSKLTREIVGRIDPAAERPNRMERHRDDGVGVIEDIDAGQTHHPAEWFGEQTPAVELERVNDFAQRTVVAARASGH